MGKRCETCGFPVEDHLAGELTTYAGCNMSDKSKIASLQNQIDAMGLHIQAMRVSVEPVAEKPFHRMSAHSIYVACPYTHASHDVRSARVAAASMVVGLMMSHDTVVFSPITHGHGLVKFIPAALRDSHEFWMAQCLPMVQWAEVFAVLPLNGWRESRGLAEELALAKSLGKPILVLQPGSGRPSNWIEIFTEGAVHDTFGPSAQLEYF